MDPHRRSSVPPAASPSAAEVREGFLRSRRSVDEGLVSEDDYLAALAARESAPLLSDLPAGDFEHLTDAIPPDFMEEFLFVPLARTGSGSVRVALASDLDGATRGEIEEVLGSTIEVVVAPRAAVLERIASMYRVENGVEAVSLDGDDGGVGTPAEELEDLANQPPVIRLVNFLVHDAFRRGASDVHLEAFEDGLKVRYRIDGLLQDVTRPPKRFQAAIVSRVKILADLDVAERRRPQDGRLRMRIDRHDVDIRVSIVPTLHGESVVLRLLDQSAIHILLEDLGFVMETLEKFRRLIDVPQGILLVTGPTGSGKTTTLYAALAKRNRPDVKIVTVEDPVEYQLPGAIQVQVRPHLGLTFANGLRSILRHDPDIIMVGEMRDYETAEIAIQAALTGHLVYSTLHTSDSAGGITRLLEVGIEDYLVCSTVNAILAQRLVRTVCDTCAKPLRVQELPPDHRILVDGAAGELRLRQGVGCDRCSGTGYRGRMGIFELLVVDEAIREAIMTRATAEKIREIARQAGMTSIREDGLGKARAGVTTIAEVLRVTGEEGDLA